MLLVLMCGATARITRLLVADAFPPVARLRAMATVRWRDGSWQAYLAGCPWCLGVWVAGLLTLVVEWHYSLPAPVLVWPTVAWVAGFLTNLETHEPDVDADEDGAG